MLAVVIPVHNEEATLARCLGSIRAAADSSSLHKEAVSVYVVLDRCSDESAAIAREFHVRHIKSAAGCVGAARAIGCARAIADGARWLANTDADSTVAADWTSAQLVAQREANADAVCGTVAVADWLALGASARRHFQARYRDLDHHRHVHGANLGVSTRAYVATGGFASIAAHEDVALVASIEKMGFGIAWSARPRVTTSARLTGRAPAGFAQYLRVLAASTSCLAAG